MATNRVVVNKNIGDFLANKDISTAKNKIALISAIHAAERLESNPLVLSEEDYQVILDAVTTGSFIVDTGRYYINVGAPVGREEFLHIKSVFTTEEGKESYSWDFELFENARPFTREEIDTIVPRPYRDDEYLLMENEGIEKWGVLPISREDKVDFESLSSAESTSSSVEGSVSVW